MTYLHLLFTKPSRSFIVYKRAYGATSLVTTYFVQTPIQFRNKISGYLSEAMLS